MRDGKERKGKGKKGTERKGKEKRVMKGKNGGGRALIELTIIWAAVWTPANCVFCCFYIYICIF